MRPPSPRRGTGGTPCAAALQVARSAARRAERDAWRLHEAEGVANPEALVYLNRLSDLLFLLARDENVRAGAEAAMVTGRFTTPDEVATLVALLASPRTGNVTGAQYVIDGGMVRTL